jgi:integrase
VDDATMAQVRRHRDDVDKRAAAAGVDLLPDAYVFAREADGASPWRPNWVTMKFIRLRDDNGLAGHRLHDLRHFMATEMLNAGVPVVVVSRRLDHKRVSTTFDRYTHAVPGQDEQASATLWHVMSTA